MNNKYHLFLLLFVSTVSIANSDTDFANKTQPISSYQTPLKYQGKTLTIAEWSKEASNCNLRLGVSKDEYETTEQFNIRKKQQANLCSSITAPLVDAEIDSNVRLVYDADQQRFIFSFAPSGSQAGSDNNPHSWLYFYTELRGSFELNQKYFDSASSVKYLQAGKTGPDAVLYGMSFSLYSKIDKARLLKTKENSLRLILKGDVRARPGYAQDRGWNAFWRGRTMNDNTWNGAFYYKEIRLIDNETNDTLFRVF